MYRLPRAAKLAFVLSLSLLSACGFQLRGTAHIDEALQIMSVSGADRSYVDALARALENSGVAINASAPYQIDVLAVNRDTAQQTQAVGQMFEQDATLRVTYQLVTNTGLALFTPMQLQRTRTLTLSQATPNISSAEQNIVFAELQDELIAATLRYLQSLSQQRLDIELARAKTALARQKAKQQETATP